MGWQRGPRSGMTASMDNWMYLSSSEAALEWAVGKAKKQLAKATSTPPARALYEAATASCPQPTAEDGWRRPLRSTCCHLQLLAPLRAMSTAAEAARP